MGISLLVIDGSARGCFRALCRGALCFADEGCEGRLAVGTSLFGMNT